MFLKKVAQGGLIIYSPSRQAFYSRKQGTQVPVFKAENYTDITGEWGMVCNVTGGCGSCYCSYGGRVLIRLLSVVCET